MSKRDQRIEAKRKLYAQIIKGLNPLIRKYGKDDVRLALNYWNNIEREKNRIRSGIEAFQRELKDIQDL